MRARMRHTLPSAFAMVLAALGTAATLTLTAPMAARAASRASLSDINAYWVTCRDGQGIPLYCVTFYGFEVSDGTDPGLPGIVGKITDVTSGATELRFTPHSNTTYALEFSPVENVFWALNVPGATTDNGTQLICHPYDGSDACKWWLEDMGNGYYVIHSALDDTKVVDVKDGAIEFGNDVQLYDANGSTAQQFRLAYAIAYYENGGSGSMDMPYDIAYPSTDHSDGASNHIQTAFYGVGATIQDNRYTAPEGYRFDSWNTQKDGSGIAYYPGNVVTDIPTIKDLGASTIGAGFRDLFAQWAPVDYAISYDLGGGKDPGNPGTYTIETGTFSLKAPTRAGYTFTGWTGSNGSTPQKDVKIEKGSTGAKEYKAHWTPNGYKIAFDGNGSTSGSTAGQDMTYDQAANLNPNGFARKGYTFGGWNTKADGSGTGYANKQSVKNLATSGTVTLYAQWDPISYTLVFNGNKATSGSTDDVPATYDKNATIPDSGYRRTGYTFKEWNTKADGSGKSYSPGDKVKNLTDKDGGTVTFYAVWDPISYTVAFDGNGAKGGETASMKVDYDQTKNLTENGFTRKGYEFTGWNTKPDGSGTGYADTQAIKNLTNEDGATITLYALWEEKTYVISIPTDIRQENMPVGEVSTTDDYEVAVTGEFPGELVVGAEDEARLTSELGASDLTASAASAGDPLTFEWEGTDEDSISISGTTTSVDTWTGAVQYEAEVVGE